VHGAARLLSASASAFSTGAGQSTDAANRRVANILLHARGETIIDRPRGRADSLASLSVGKATRQGVEARGAKYDPCSAMLTLETIREAPKALLHDHLDGGLRPETVLELASEAGYRGLPTSDPAAEPADDEEQLREHDPPEAELGEARRRARGRLSAPVPRMRSTTLRTGFTRGAYDGGHSAAN